MMPVVTATTPWAGFLPVAKAFGWAWSMMQTLGMGRPAAEESLATTLKSSGASASVTGFAPYILSIILSLNQ